MTPTVTSTPPRTQTAINTPSVTSTMSVTATVSTAIKPTSGSTGIDKDRDSKTEELLTRYGLIAGALCMILACAFFVIYKRRKNQLLKKHSGTVLECYMKQMESTVDTDSPTTGKEEEGIGVKHNVPYRQKGKRRHYPFSTSNVVTANPLKADTITKASDYTAPNIEIIETSMWKDKKEADGVKIVSVKTPKLRTAAKSGSKLRLARIIDLDTSDMGIISRGLLKLRQIKASLLAEASPLVEVRTKRTNEKNENAIISSRRREAFLRRLEFANQQGGDRSVIDSEVQVYRSFRMKSISQAKRKRKKFIAVPRSMEERSNS